MYDSEKSQYQLEAVVDKDIISTAGQRLGRLYVFTVEEDSLQHQGIKQQWFMTCQQEVGGTVMAGHINEAGQWSLCTLGNLQPSPEWKPQKDILAAIFNSERQILLSDKQLSSSTEDTNSEETKYDVRAIEKTVTTPVVQTMSVNTIVSGNETDDREEIIQQEFVTQIKITEEQRLKLEQQLATVIVTGHQQGLLSFDGAYLSPPFEDKSSASGDKHQRTARIFDAPALLVQEERSSSFEVSIPLDGTTSNPKASSPSRAVSAPHDQDSQNFWQLNLDPDRNVLILRSRDDGHVVIAVSFDGEVVSSLSASDAELLGDGLLTQADLEKIKKTEVKQQSLKTEITSTVLQPTKLQEAKKSQDIQLDY
jgi:hypothetical protein